MRTTVFVAGLMAASLTAFSAMAEEGQYKQPLQRMITDAAGGRCSVEIMGAGLLAACNQQIAAMSAGLASLGAVESMTFVKAETGEHGRVETYAVKFAGGLTLNWFIGGEKDGKFEVAGTAPAEA